MNRLTPVLSSPPRPSGPASPAEDVALLHRLAAQDPQAFDAFYVRYGHRLQHYLTRLLGDPTLADDVCQDVFLVVWQQAARFPATVPLWAWLCGIARHKARTAWARTVPRALTPGAPAARQVAPPDVLLLQLESERRFQQALDMLPFSEQTTLRLLMQAGGTYQDIAAIMDTPVSTVRTRVWRACHRLRASLATVDVTPPRAARSRTRRLTPYVSGRV